MDYALGKHSHNHNPKSMRRIHRTGEDAGRFLFSPYGYSLERLLRVTQLDSSINLNRVRQMAEKAETPQYNTLVERGKR